MKAINVLVGVVLAMCVSFGAHAGKIKAYENYDQAVEVDRAVKRMMRGYDQEGWVEMSREMQMINYFAAPTSDYKYGELIITMRLSDDSNYSLTTYYDMVNVVIYADIETGGYYVNNVYVESQVVY